MLKTYNRDRHIFFEGRCLNFSDRDSYRNRDRNRHRLLDSRVDRCWDGRCRILSAGAVDGRILCGVDGAVLCGWYTRRRGGLPIIPAS